MKSKIISIGSYTPNNIVTNQDLEERVDTTDEWIVSRTGIKERPIADDSQATSDLAYEAAKIAIERAKIDKNDIDLIIVGTCTLDVATPNVGTLIQKRLDLKNFPAFSIEAACSGFIYALNIADKVSWVWLDYFTRFPIDIKQANLLKSAGLNLCLVSPELHGFDLTRINVVAEEILIGDFEIDAICTKKPEIWKALLG